MHRAPGSSLPGEPWPPSSTPSLRFPGSERLARLPDHWNMVYRSLFRGPLCLQDREAERQPVREISAVCWLTPQCRQQPELGQAEATILALNPAPAVTCCPRGVHWQEAGLRSGAEIQELQCRSLSRCSSARSSANLLLHSAFPSPILTVPETGSDIGNPETGQCLRGSDWEEKPLGKCICNVTLQSVFTFPKKC